MALFGGANDIRIRFLADTTQVGAGVKEMGGGIASGLGLASIGWAAAGTAAVAFGKQSVDAALEAEDAAARLATTYEKFPALHDVSLKSLNDLADATLKKTRYDDEAARAAEGVLAQYHLTGTQIETLLPLVTDFAAKTGKDLPTAASAIGKALLGNTRALKEVGVNYKLTGDAATDYANIVRLLTEQVGGAAAADAETTAGKLAMLKNQYGELKESLGAALLPLIQYLAPALIQILEVLSMSFKGWGLIIKEASDLGISFGDVLSVMAGPVIFLATHLDLVTGALGWLGAAFVTVGGWITGAFGSALSWVRGMLNDVGAVITDVAGWVSGVFAGAWGAAEGAIDAVARAVGWLMDKLRGLKSLWDSVSGFIGKIGGIIGLSAPPPGAASLALAGGAGPTVYGAPRAFGGGGASSGGAVVVNVNVHGNIGDPAVVGRRTVEALSGYVRANGARALRSSIGLA